MGKYIGFCLYSWKPFLNYTVLSYRAKSFLCFYFIYFFYSSSLSALLDASIFFFFSLHSQIHTDPPHDREFSPENQRHLQEALEYGFKQITSWKILQISCKLCVVQNYKQTKLYTSVLKASDHIVIKKKKKKLGFFSVYIKIAQTSRYYTPTPHCSQASWQSPLRWPMSQLTGAVSRDISGVGAIETVSWDVRAFLPSARSTHQPEKKTKHFHLSSLPQCPRTLPLLILHQV